MSNRPESNPLIKCVDCLHAKQYREVSERTGRYILKVRCKKGHWKHGKSDGSCDLHRVMARRTSKCPDYVSTSESEADRQAFLKELASSLPLERIVFESDGQAADITEVGSWSRAI